MTKLLENALEAVRALSDAEQDEIARIIIRLTDENERTLIHLTGNEREAITRSKSAAAAGAIASDEEVRAVWLKHGV